MSDFGDDLPKVSQEFYQQMNSALGNSKNSVLLIFDEIENISPKTAASPHRRHGLDVVYFWQILRSYLQSESRGRISICIVGTSPHILETARIDDIANPIYLYAQKSFIPTLEFDETREMVERLGYFMGLEFPSEVIANLQKEFGGHPFFTRQVCSKIHQLASPNRPLQVSRQALERAKLEFAGQLQSYLRDIIDHLKSAYPEEFVLLKAVLSGDTKEVTEYGREAPDLIDHLVGYGLIAKVGEDYDIRFEAIRTALRHLLIADDVEGRWAELSRCRNAVETNIRIALYHWSKSVSAEDWADVLSSNLTTRRFGELKTLEPGVLLSSKESPLYLTDLLMLLKDGRVLVYLGVRRSSILQSIDVLNKVRRDAHAIVVSDEDLVASRTAFDVLQAEFAAP